MTEEPLTLRRKRLLHRSRYRGCLECDLLLGRFVARYIDRLDDVELAQLEALLEERDQDILAWYTGRDRVPPRHDNRIFALLRRFEIAT